MFPGLRFTEKYIYSGENRYDRALVEKIIRLASDPSIEHVVIDCFAGFGGVTGGFLQIQGYMVIACINHWFTAIETHNKNYPDCLHLQEDFKTANLSIILYMITQIKRNNPGAKVHVWYSLECTNFSGAKGGMPRNADSRTLAEHVDRYVMVLEPDVMWVENVKEFLLYGPMIPKVITGSGKTKKTLQFNPHIDDAETFFKPYIDEQKYPYCPLVVNKKEGFLTKWEIPEDATKGQYFREWKNYICSFGYEAEERLLNCADYGIPQHRVRLIMQFNPVGVPAKYPCPTHNKKGVNGLLKWEPVKPCLDLDEEGDSVLAFITRKGKLVPRISSAKTIDRLINGITKNVLSGDDVNWIIKSNSAKNNKDQSSGSSVNSSSPTLTCYNGLYIGKVHLIDHYFGNGYVKPVSQPMGTTGTKDGAALHTVQFLGTYYTNGQSIPLTNPSGAIVGNDKQPLISVGKFIMDTQYDKPSIELDQPCKTITANRKYFYLVNFQWFNSTLSPISKPSNTIIARQDKAPSYLVTLSTGELAIEVFENDPPHYVKLKKFMAENGIASVNMRMLKETEMLRIMTIPEDMKLSTSKTKNKKMIGNAVPSELVRRLGLAYAEETEVRSLTA